MRRQEVSWELRNEKRAEIGYNQIRQRILFLKSIFIQNIVSFVFSSDDDSQNIQKWQLVTILDNKR